MDRYFEVTCKKCCVSSIRYGYDTKEELYCSSCLSTDIVVLRYAEITNPDSIIAIGEADLEDANYHSLSGAIGALYAEVSNLVLPEKHAELARKIVETVIRNL